MKRKNLLRALLEYHDGLHLKDSVLWFDAPKPQQLCFVSHANVDGALDHQKILTTELTHELLQGLSRMHGRGRRAHEPQALVTPYRRPFSLGQLSLELFPSGFVLGSASLLVEVNGVTIVYAGEINPRKSELVERLEARRCEVLVLSSRFSLRRFVFPPFERVAQGIVSFAQKALERKSTPVFFCQPLGEAQEVAHLLLRQGLPVRAHRQILATSRVYTQSGAPLGELKRLAGSSTTPAAVLWPIGLRTSPSLAKLPSPETAFVSGLAVDEKARQAAACDAAFALSARADYAGMLEYVRACSPDLVVLCQAEPGGELAGDLQAMGIEVASVGPPVQMPLF